VNDLHFLPGYSESPTSDSVLDRVLSDLISPLAKSTTPIPLVTYRGNIPVDRSTETGFLESSKPTTTPSCSDPAWSRGLGFEISPLKTRSGRRLAGAGINTLDTPASSSKQRALRGIKAQARVKP
jgi:hypothetical protein